MKLHIESTEKIVQVNGVPARIWEGATESGTPVHCYITRVAVSESVDAERIAEFGRELKECRKPSAAIDAMPTSLVL